MDWQIRLALLIIGIGVIGFIIYDYNRRKQAQKQTQKLIEQVKVAANQVDSLGFDINGVGSVRKTSNQTNGDTVQTQSVVCATEKLTLDVSHHKTTEPMTEAEHQSDRQESIQQKIDQNLEAAVKAAPTEQLDLADFSELDSSQSKSSNSVHQSNKKREGSDGDEQVFALILQAPREQTYIGNDFMPIFLSQGLRHGDMDIFHRQPTQTKSGQANQRSNVLYSVANAINPGTFDIDNIESFATPAFAFFMTIPGPQDPLMAYDAMVKTLKLLKQELGGQILDQTKSVFTEQTQQYQRETIQAYLTKSLIS
jgi:cell division protein ZipA